MNHKGIIAFFLILIMVLSAFPIMDLIEVEGKDGSFGGGSGTVGDPYLIEDVWDLQEMKEDLSAHYVLGNDIDASEAETWNDGAGFIPIGERYYHLMDGWIEHPFTGSLDGSSHIITGLFINRPETPSIGFFGYVGSEGSVKNVGLVNNIVTGNSSVGGLVGLNEGTMSNCYSTGNVTGANRVGGLVGSNNDGTLSNCYSTVDVNGTATWNVWRMYVGGLVGENIGIVENCHSTGNVIGNMHVGGLAGYNMEGTVNNSYATGIVSGEGSIGGLVGQNDDTVANSYATGRVTADGICGGLIGLNNEGTVSNCYATGSVSGTGDVGGLMGVSGGTVSTCYASGSISGTSIVGGLMGSNGGTVSICYAIGNVSGTGDNIGGLVGSNSGTVSICYATGSVSGESSIGGLAGFNYGTVSNCYTTSMVRGTGSNIGGLLGLNFGGTVSCCYAVGSVSESESNIGGLVGSNQNGTEEGTVEMCYWDMDTTGQIDSDGGEGRTTVDMILKATYVAWDFGRVWDIVEGREYPFLQALPPAARILSPRHSGTLVRGDSLRFSGSSVFDPDVGYRWTFSDGRIASVPTPGLVSFQVMGAQEISYAFVLDGKEHLDKDTRTFEVVDDTLAYPDLKVADIDIPDTLIVGEYASITYTVRNIGDATLTGESWQDAIYLSDDPYLDAVDKMLAFVSVAEEVEIGGTYDGTLNITPPPVKDGAYYLILSINDDWSFVERHRLNDQKDEAIDIAIPELKDGIAHTSEYSTGLVEQYFRLNIPSGRSIHLTLDGANGLEFSARFNNLPTRANHDHHSSNGRLVIPTAYTGTWYVLVRGDQIPESGSYTIKYKTVSLILDKASPSRHVSGISLELMLTGVGFIAPLQVVLVGADGSTYQAVSARIHSTTQITAYFPAHKLPADTYTIRVDRPDIGTAELKDFLKVLAEGEPKFEARLILPEAVSYNALATLYVEYENTGDVSMSAPLLLITGVQEGRRAALLTLDHNLLKSGIWTSANPRGCVDTIQLLASGEIPGVIQPGESRRVPVYYIGWQHPWDLDYAPIEWYIYMINTDDDTAVNWDALKEEMRPEHIRTDAWEIIWNRFTELAGDTYGALIRMLRRNALYLYRQGQRVEDIDQLLSLTIHQAEGLCPFSVLFDHQDTYVQGPGLSISFERYYFQSISRHFEMGPLGRGWVHNWQFAIEEKNDGTVELTDMTGKARIFQPDNRYNGRYLAQPGDWGDLRALSGGGFMLKEANDHLQVYGADGKLDYTEDLNGNRISCIYTDERLTRLTHSSGHYLEISYNNNGHISVLTDTAGRDINYFYQGEYLSSVQANDGYTLTYNYDTTEGSAAEHALTGVSFPNEDKIFIDYDGRGRLNSIYRDGEEEKLTFTYDLGVVKVTDVLDNTEVYFFDHVGRITRFDNVLGEIHCFGFNDMGQLKQVTDPAGFVMKYDHNKHGNLVEMTDQLGQKTWFTYSSDFDRITRTVDPAGTSTGYDHDENGNLIEAYYIDGSFETWSYDVHGNPITWKNRRGNTTGYSYDPAGRLTGKVYADDTEIKCNYDERGNLIRVEDGSGITEFTFNADDYVVRIDYPGDRWLEFTYDEARHRNSSLDQLGNRLNYQYDYAGRMEVLTDGSENEIVRYEYDLVGRLSKKTMESGTYTTYGYDAAGRITKLANFNPDDTVLSWFNYTYDLRGRRTRTNTHYGTWTYEYDDNDQLIRAVLDSTDQNIPSQDLMYVYDMNGNRVKTVMNGKDETYIVNNLDQYILVGDVNYTYDLDGNLIREEGPDGTNTYTYGDENRLIGVSRGVDTWHYTYDGLGNRVVETENNSTSHFVVDPIGLGNVVGTYDETGTLISRYLYGSDLVGVETGTGEAYFYNFDAIGNAHDLTDSTGVAVNSYAYRPFGDPILSQEMVSNPFRFVGEQGVMSDPTGLIYMRARQFSPQIGRFLTTDPIGISSGDINFYRYVYNSPTNHVDPTGLIPWGKVLNPTGYIPYSNVGGSVGGEIGGAVGAGFDIYSGIKSVALGASIVLAPVAGLVGIAVGAGLLIWGAYNIITGAATILEFFGITSSWSSFDPNQKLSTSGYGPMNHVPGGSLLSYHVDFENMEEATAPAQIVTIRDPLSEDFDWSTFEFAQIGFGDVIIPLDEGTRYLEKVVEYRYSDDEYDMDIEVHIDAGIDMETGEVFVNFFSIDPGTELPPTVDKGFLPPEDETGRGKGFFSYIVQVKDDLPSGTEIRNIATIQFDFGLSIDTNQIDPLDKTKGTDPDLEALVTIDAGLPESRVNALTENVGQTFEVSWSGQDDEGGSGIADYDVFVSENEGPWTLWLEDTNLTSANYEGEIGSTYSFYSIATDNVGHHEEKQALAEAVATVVAVTGPTANAGPDQRVDKGTMVTFDGSASTDNVGIVNYTWTFNDGTEDITLYGVGPSHLFTIPGDYTITLNVTNSVTYWDSDSMELTVDPDEERKFNYFLFVIGMILLVVIIFGILSVVILVRSRKGSLDEE